MIRKQWIVPPESSGTRAGEFLRRVLPSMTESALRRCFDARDVRVNGKRIRKDCPLSGGDEICVYLPDGADTRELNVVYEDGDVLLVSKLPGISVVSDHADERTLTVLCREYVREKDPEAFAPVPCHRLDNQTGGLCLFARNDHALSVLLDVFRHRTLDKRYVCLVRGMMKPPAAVCHAFLLKDSDRGRVRILTSPQPGAVPIVTEYETLESGPVSRLLIHLITGRTHQIRAHLSALGHPLLGDDVYGDRALNRSLKVRSLRLWAVSLTLDTGGRLPQLDGRVFRSEPPF